MICLAEPLSLFSLLAVNEGIEDITAKLTQLTVENLVKPSIP